MIEGDCLEEMARMPDESVGLRGAVPPSQQAIRRLPVDPQFLPRVAGAAKRRQVVNVVASAISPRHNVMNLGPVVTATDGTAVAVPLKCFSSALFPFTVIGADLATSPKNAVLAGLSLRFALVGTRPRTRNVLVTTKARKLGVAYNAGSGFSSAATPSVAVITVPRTELLVIGRRRVELRPTFGTGTLGTVSRAVRRYAGLTLVPGNRLGATFGRAVNLTFVSSVLTAAGLTVSGNGAHRQIVPTEPEYRAIAEARIEWWSQYEGDTAEILAKAGLSEKAEKVHTEVGQLTLGAE